MINTPKTLPFFGSGVGFPFRLSPSTGGVMVTTGNTDAISVALQYLQDNWTIREDAAPSTNHIAEAIGHILLTRPTEHDTLPEFGSRLFLILFEPDTNEFRQLAEAYFKFATVRWEKRARIPDTTSQFTSSSGVRWKIDGRNVDMGILPVYTYIEFITQQALGNLVLPFVTDRQARLQEYPSSVVDSNGHDYMSRYKGATRSYRDGSDYIRLRRYTPLPFSSGDTFHTVMRGDTWLLLSWRFYNDIRYWHILARCYVNDAANAGLDRSYLNTLADPPIGTLLRVPSRTRILLETANV